MRYLADVMLSGRESFGSWVLWSVILALCLRRRKQSVRMSEGTFFSASISRALQTALTTTVCTLH